MKELFTVALLFVVGCQSSPKLDAGQWTGFLSPMNHPEMQNSLSYDISYDEGVLKIDIHGPNNTVMKTRNPRVENDSLYFSFTEPEEEVLLNCVLGKSKAIGFAGKCTDSEGKWARFTMLPPGKSS